VDELTQWLEDAYTYLFSRLRRRTDIPCPTRMRAGSNPGGRGAEWVRRRFIEFAKHVGTGITARQYIEMRNRGEPLPDPPYFESPPSSEAELLAREFGVRAQGAYFVPAFKEDNPGLNLAEYRANLMRMTAGDRAQLEKGDWWSTAGGVFFRPEWFQYADADEAPRMFTARYWDLAATKLKKGRDPDWSAGVRGGLERTEAGGTRIWIVNARRTREEPGGTESFVLRAAKEDGRSVPVHIEQEPGSAGKNNTHNYATKVLVGHQVYGFPKTGPKPEYWKPLSSDAQNGMVVLVRAPWNDEFVSELCALTNDDSHAHDDYADAAGGLRAVLFDDSGLANLRHWRK
jgi:predicted phage terminase large subunit-like protein